MIRYGKKTKVHNALYVIVCERCGVYLASASEPEWLPEFSTCSCDELDEDKENKRED